MDNSNSHIDERSKDRSQNDNLLDDYKYENYSNRKLDSNVDDTNSNSNEQDKDNNENLKEKDGKNKNEDGNNEEEKTVNEFDPNKGSLYLQINLICRILKLYKKMI